MLFNSGHFFFFFLVFYLLYILIGKNLRLPNGRLLAASYFFYGFWDYHFLGLILVSTAVDFIAAKQIELFKAAGKSSKARYWLWLSVMVNLGILGFFKYFNFFIDSFTQLFGAYAVMSNHYYLVIKACPEQLVSLSDDDINDQIVTGIHPVPGQCATDFTGSDNPDFERIGLCQRV